jgi:hypothetical protein
MEDITDRMYAYRECARVLWNMGFRTDAVPDLDFDAVDAYRDVCRRLFNAIVLEPIGAIARVPTGRREPFIGLQISPRFDPVPAMIRRPTDQGIYWDDPVKELKTQGLSLVFIDFYDFDDFGYIDLRYYLVRVLRCGDHPELVGRDALIDVRHAEVHHDPTEP